MKSNLKEQVADLQKELQELRKWFESLQNRMNTYLIPRLQRMDKELVDLKDKFWQDETLSRISELEKWRASMKQVNDIFFEQFREFVNVMDGTVSPEEAMSMYQEMLSKFLKLSEKLVKVEAEPSD